MAGTVWALFNLRSSPFVRRPADPLPLDLVVGRDDVFARVLDVLAARTTSVQTVEGPSGAGVTTVVRAVGAASRRHGGVAPDASLVLGAGDSTDTVLLAILRATYGAILGFGGAPIANAEPLGAARTFLRLARLHALATDDATDPYARQLPDWMEVGAVVPELITELLTVVEGPLARAGVVLPVEIRAGATASERIHAARVLAEIWPALPSHGLHLVLDDSPQDCAAALTAHGLPPRIERVAPLEAAEVWVLLSRRAWWLRADPARRVIVPIEGAALEQLVQVFGGDLASLLGALEYAADELVGYGEDVTAPMSAEDIRAALRGRTQRTVAAVCPAIEDVPQLLAATPPQFTLTDLARAVDAAWTRRDGGAPSGVAAPTVRGVLTALERSGCIRRAADGGGDAGAPRYCPTGVVRLVDDTPLPVCADRADDRGAQDVSPPNAIVAGLGMTDGAREPERATGAPAPQAAALGEVLEALRVLPPPPALERPAPDDPLAYLWGG